MRHKVLISLVALLFLSPTAHASKNFTVGGDRPVLVRVPAQLSVPAPLLIMLHSASTNGGHQERYMKLAPVASAKGMIYIAPNGTLNKEGKRTWNASKSCCQGPESTVDDVAYIQSLINEIDQKVKVDRSKIYLIGHSNGGFMALDFACRTGQAAAVISLAGAMDQDFKCAPSKPFALLQIHGTKDATIKFGGGVLNNHPYTSAEETVRRVKALGGQAVLWRIDNGSHSPRLPQDFAKRVLSFAQKAVD
jgi:polyhydroxybutyrate depolymerase